MKSGYLKTPDLLLEMKPVGILGIDDLMKTTNYEHDVCPFAF